MTGEGVQSVGRTVEIGIGGRGDVGSIWGAQYGVPPPVLRYDIKGGSLKEGQQFHSGLTFRLVRGVYVGIVGLHRVSTDRGFRPQEYKAIVTGEVRYKVPITEERSATETTRLKYPKRVT